MFSSDCITVIYLVNANKHEVLVNKRKRRSKRFFDRSTYYLEVVRTNNVVKLGTSIAVQLLH